MRGPRFLSSFPRLLSHAAPWLFAGLALLGAQPSHALCDSQVGAFGVCANLDGAQKTQCQNALWGELIPADTGQLPFERDTTRYAGSSITDHDFPLWQSADVEEGFLFTAYWNGIEIWDVRGEHARSPKFLSYYDGRNTGAPVWTAPDEDSEKVAMADAPSGNSGFLAVAVDHPAGVLLFDTSHLSSPTTEGHKPRLMYQDHTGKGTTAVYAAEIGQRAYAFVTLSQGASGIGLYDLTAARQAGFDRCAENAEETIQCPGVSKGRITSSPVFGHIDGTASPSGDRHFIAASAFLREIQLWDVSDPLQPTQIVSGLDHKPNEGIALWSSSNPTRYYLAVEGEELLRIFDVTTCLQSGCSQLPQPISTFPTSFDASHVTFSRAGDGTPFLYVGSTNACGGGDQREWLLDVSDPRNPRDISPQGPFQAEDDAGNLVPTDYWGWYYSSNPTGFSRVAPKRGQFNGDFFYRAAGSILDVHEWTTSEPTIDVDGPLQAFAGDAVTLTAEAVKCTPIAGSWTWKTDGGQIAGSTTGSSVSVTWSTPGTTPKSVVATNPGCPGVEGTHEITIEDPVPAIASVSASPNPALECQKVEFSANGVTGKEPITLSWEVRDSSEAVVEKGGDVNPFVFDTEGLPAENYVATVTAQNGSELGIAKSPELDLQPLLDLALTADRVPSCFPKEFCSDPPAPPIGATVAFSIDDEDQGATEWRWDFGEGAGFGPWISDPEKGPNPTHTFGSKGTFQVRVQTRNCQAGPITSDELAVQVNQLQPLVAGFNVDLGGCTSLGCNATSGTPVTFTDESLGAPDTCHWNWGDGESETAPCGTSVEHTFTTEGTHQVSLTVSRGAESDATCDGLPTPEEDSCPPPINVSSPTPEPQPSISIFGATSGTVGQVLEFRAEANNCTPAAQSWSWSVAGGSISGPQNDSSVRVSWSTTGRRRLTASNSGCGSATGSHSVRIGSGDDGGGGSDEVQASFSYSPQSPKPGQEIAFDASASTGNVSFSWDFGDGTSGLGKTVKHAYADGGSYTVTLNVVVKGCLSAGCLGDSESQTVLVGDGNPSLAASFVSGAECTEFVAGAPCTVETGNRITFTATTEGATRHEWDFGDGTRKLGEQVTYSWPQPGTYTVTYTASDGEDSDTVSRTFQVEGAPVSKVEAVVVPWIAQAEQDKALPQASDLNVHNTGNDPLKLEVTFKRRGKPEENPPSEEVTIPANATVQYPNVLEELLGVEDSASGFLEIEVISGSGKPVVSSANRTFTDDGRIFGQVVPGVSLPRLPLPVKESPETLHLVGLNDTPDRLSYFGLTNPAKSGLRFELRLYDKFGELTGETPPNEPDGVRPQSQRQYQVEQLRERFGIEGLDDFRIEVVPEAGNSPPLLYAANLRLFSKDPSFLRVGRTDQDDVFLLGTLNTPGLNDSLFQSDVVLANVDDGAAECALTFTSTGVRADPTEAIVKDLPPRETLRLENVVSEWDVGNSVGVLRVRCDGENGVAPVVQGESYDVSRPPEIYGQFMPALSAEQAARPGLPHSLVGLRRDDESRTTVWLYNPSEDEVALYAVRYFDSAGNEVGGESDLRLGPGKFRQINPGHHPEEVQGDFVVRIEVSQGSVLSAAQVVNEANDPAYVVGR